MYYFLGYREMIIDEAPWYKILILSYDKCAVTYSYIRKNEDNEKLVKSFSMFQDITDKIHFSVKSNGSISIHLISK